MANIRSQKIDESGVEIAAGDGTVLRMSSAQIRALLIVPPRSRSLRRQRMLDRIQLVLGNGSFDAESADFDSDDAGNPLSLEVRNS